MRAETEGLYLTVGDLKYQVQVSRQLNAADPEDRGFLVGVPADERELDPGEVWFGVFLRVENDEGEVPLAPAHDIEIEDTQDTVYEPMPLDESNVFAYRSTEPIPPGGLIPERDSPPAETPIQGSLLLFKVTNASLDNRPLELKIDSRSVPQQTGIIDLDV